MPLLRDEQRTGLASLEAATVLLQRIRSTDPVAGLYEAADLHWWWGRPRSTDQHPQVFWFDRSGRPEAAVITTDWSDRIALDPIVMPGAPPDLVAHVLERGLADAERCGIRTLDLEADPADSVVMDVLLGHGFEATAHGVVEAWLSADDRPGVSPLPVGYRSSSRLDTATRPHHMVPRNGPDIESRLLQTTLYRPDLDLVVLHGDDVAAYGLFWFDRVTNTGLVEPMRTDDAHQRRGLARHVLTAGVERRAQEGARRIKICFEPDNDAARALYLDVGFEPVRRTVALSRTAPPA